MQVGRLPARAGARGPAGLEGVGPDAAPVRAAPARPPTLQSRVFSCLYEGDRIYVSELLPAFPIIIAVRCVCASSGAVVQCSLIVMTETFAEHEVLRIPSNDRFKVRATRKRVV